jgi:hypothetical protein
MGGGTTCHRRGIFEEVRTTTAQSVLDDPAWLLAWSLGSAKSTEDSSSIMWGQQDAWRRIRRCRRMRTIQQGINCSVVWLELLFQPLTPNLSRATLHVDVYYVSSLFGGFAL